jgi:hypothetical protein
MSYCPLISQLPTDTDKQKVIVTLQQSVYRWGYLKKTNRGSENDSTSEKSLMFNLICFDVPASISFICIVCNLSYRDLRDWCE